MLAAGGDSPCSATVDVAVVLEVSSEKFHTAAYTLKWLGRTRIAPTSSASPNFYDESFHITQTACIYLDTAAVSVKGVQLCVIPMVQPQESVPAAGGESHCSATYVR